MTKPIIFNSCMTKAILDGRKTTTRRLVTPQPVFRNGETGTPEPMDDGTWQFSIDQYNGRIYDCPCTPPYYAGDILYVRESWAMACDLLGAAPGPVYMADYSDSEMSELKNKHFNWRPSVHMPKWAARLFLRVTSVRMERLKDITASSALSEGFADWPALVSAWDSAIPAAKRSELGWNANPWVWVIEFERTDMPSHFLG